MTLPYPPPYMDIGVLAEHLSVCEDTIAEWVRLGILPPPKKKRGKRLWKWAQVEQYLDAEDNPGAPSAEDEAQRITQNTRALVAGRQ